MAHFFGGPPAINNSNNEATRDDITSNTTSPTVTAATGQGVYTSRTAAPGRRRFFSRASQASRPSASRPSSSASASTSASNNTMFNPQATDFVPTMVTSSKRKASSSAKSGKSLPSSFRAPAGEWDASLFATNLQAGLPIIKSKDLFATTEAAITTASVYALDRYTSETESEEDLDLQPPGVAVVPRMQYPPSTFPPPTGPRRSVVATMPSYFPRTKQSEASKAGETVPRYSAVLVSREIPSARSETDGVTRARYLPLCSASVVAPGCVQGDLTVLSSHRERIDTLEHESPFRATWPAKSLPVELFDLITAHLARDDIKNMRLVNHEFEANVSAALFRTCVVPFNTELYDMIDDEAKTKIRPPTREIEIKPRAKGKGRATDADSVVDLDSGGLPWQNAKEDKEGKVYKGHGLKVFQGFGPHIKRFGMSFEVSESQLSQPPAKKELDHIDSYHGAYNWPPPYYARFANLAGLEHTADETSRMKSAFDKLKVVQELGLSVVSGLGWLSGLDKSARAHVFERPSSVFGCSYSVSDHQAQAATEFWAALQESQASFQHGHNAKEVTLGYRELNTTPASLEGLQGTAYSDTQLWSAIDSTQVLPRGVAGLKDSHRLGVLYTTSAHGEALAGFTNRSSVIPNDLRKEQKEWLLETEWAQRAFLESYMLAIVDNPSVFENVTVLNIAKLSSGFLPMLGREHFWEALPSLQDVTLHVSPDWRSVARDNAAYAETTTQNPSEAVRLFYSMLKERLAPNETIKKLNIGWIGGGEHAEGVFARNTNILPAPVTQLEHSTANNNTLSLVFDHVEHLTLTNCWITPPTLAGLIKSHADKSLTKLTLGSVSLTAHPRFPANGQQGIAQHMQILANANAQLHQAQNVLNGQQPLAIGQYGPYQGGQWQNGNPNAQQIAHFHAQAQHLAQAQQQMQQQFQQMQQMNMFAAGQQMPQFNNVNFPPLPPQQPFAGIGFAGLPVPAPPAQVAVPLNPGNPPAPQPPAHWTAGHREGSWPEMLNSLSPGPIYSDYLPQPEAWEEQLPARRATTLQTIEFNSCGYAKILHNAPFDQLMLEPVDLQHGNTNIPSPWFRMRQAGLKPYMMETRDRYVAQIMQNMPWRELNALQLAWGLTEGWQDRSKAEEAEWDGYAPGGTGRFSGVVQKGMPLVSAQGH